MTKLFWHTEDHGYPFRKWLQAELPVKMPDGIKDGKVRLVLTAVEIKAKEAGYLWTAQAMFEGPTEEGQALESVTVYVGGAKPAGMLGHLENENHAKTACVNGAKLALLELINDLR